MEQINLLQKLLRTIFLNKFQIKTKNGEKACSLLYVKFIVKADQKS